MKCTRFMRILPGYLYGEATEGERRGLLAHADSCPACRALFQEMEETVSRLESIEAPRFTPSEMSALRARVREEAARRRARRPGILRELIWSFRYPRGLRAAAAAVVLAAALVIVSLRTSGPPAAAPEVGAVLSLTEDIEAESLAVSEICQEIDRLQSILSPDSSDDHEAGRTGGIRTFAA